MEDSQQIMIDYIENLLYTTPKLIKPKIRGNERIFNHREEFYIIKRYIENFLEGKTKQRFIIMPGLRGVGKTTILYQIYDYLLNEKNIDSERILFLNLDRIKDFTNFDLQNYVDCFLKDIHEAYPLVNQPVFIFVDESQYSNKWDNVGKIIYDEDENVFLIFTGSDALNLEFSKESARRSLNCPVYPLNFSQYLYLKHNIQLPNTFSNSLFDLIWTGNCDNAIKLEKNIKKEILTNLPINPTKEFNYYLKFGELPFSFDLEDYEIIQQTIDMKNRIIEKDLDIISSFTSPNRMATYKLINMLAIQKPGDISQNTIANTLDIAGATVSSIISALEKTQLIFHCEPYGSSQKRTTKSWKYYFLSNQIKSCIYLNIFQASSNPKDFLGLISENYVASALFKMKAKKGNFGIFYDSDKKGVDFLLNNTFGEIIPIEVGTGKKSIKQVKLAIKKKNSTHGILISDRTDKIVKEDDIINIPLSTFSLM